MNGIIHISRNKAKTAKIKCCPNSFNGHFLSLTDSILNFAGYNTANDHEISPPLKKFCEERISTTDSFKVLSIAIHEVGAFVAKLTDRKAMGPDNISFVLLNLTVPYATESLTFIYDLCVQYSTPPSPSYF